MTPAERQAKHRAKRQKEGLTLLRVWVPDDKLQAAKDAVKQITGEDDEIIKQ